MEKKFVSKESFLFFLDFYLSFRNIKWNFDFFFEFSLNFLESYGRNSLIKSAMGFVVRILWTFLMLEGTGNEC